LAAGIFDQVPAAFFVISPNFYFVLNPMKLKCVVFAAAALFFCCVSSPHSLAVVANDHQVLDPEKSDHLVESDHFVARWKDDDGVELTEAEIRKGLQKLEQIRAFYLGTVGFPEPYLADEIKYKCSINLSNKGWASGSGTGKKDPAMWLHFNAFKDEHALAHEFAHCLQFSSLGMRDSRFVGWFWESHAEWMTHQMFRHQVGSSDQLLNAPHLYYGSTRNRYGNWQFWEYIKDQHGYSAINDIWTKSKKQNEPDYLREDPVSVLARNMGWSISELNDQFGNWAMHNVTWDYQNGDSLRSHYKSYVDRSEIRRNRVAILTAIDADKGRYRIPDYRAPQRFGYNLVRIVPDSKGGKREVNVWFKGYVQKKPGVERFSGDFENEPDSLVQPDSDWRWGLVAVNKNSEPRYSVLQRGAESKLNFPLQPDEEEVWLVVVATPTTMHQIFWDQIYYSIYRYPWAVQIEGGQPEVCHIPPLTAVMKATNKKNGAPHPHGGGWVDASASVDETAYVGPQARVLENAQVRGNTRLEDYAIAKGRSIVSENAVLRGNALVDRSGRVSGNAIVEEEASVYEGEVTDDARIGALTLIESGRTQIAGKAVVRAVMNRVRDVKLSGSVQLIGDIELHSRELSQGVFYGMVTDDYAKNNRWGAKRTKPEPEVTTTGEPN